MLLRSIFSILALFLSMVLLTSGNTMLGTLLALRMEIEGYTAARSGVVLAFYAVGFVLGSLYSIRIIRRVGHIRAFSVFGASACAAILLHSLYVHTDLWLALRLLVGFCVAGLLLIVESWVNAVATAQTRGTLLAVYLVLFYLAASGGQLLIGFGNAAQYPLFIVAAILVALSLVPLSLTQSVAPQLPEAARVGVREIFDKAPLAVAGALLSGVAMAAFSTMGPIYAARIGLDTSRLSQFMGMGVISAMLFQWPVGKLSDHFPRSRVILALGLSAMAAGGLVAYTGERSVALLFLAVALYVGFASSLYPVSLALAHDQMHIDQIVGTNATLLLAFGVGTIGGPLFGSVAIWLIGPAGLFMFATVVMGVLAVTASYYWRSTPQVPVQDQQTFVAVSPIATPALMELDPRDETYEQREEAAREHQREHEEQKRRRATD